MRLGNFSNNPGFAIYRSILSSNQIQLDSMCSGFLSAVSNPLNTLPMTAASLSSQVFKLASLSLGAGRLISSAISLLGEAAVFRTSSWALSERRQSDNLLDLRSYARTVMDLGVFKTLHSLLPAQNILFRNGVQAAGMLAAEEVATSISWAEESRESLGSRFAQAFATSVEMEVGLGLAGFASGHRLEVMRRSVEGAAAVFAEGERFRRGSRTFTEREILSMHSPYRATELKKIPNPSALHAKLTALEKIGIENTGTHPEGPADISKSLDAVEEVVLSSKGLSKIEQNLLRYMAVRVVLQIGKFYTDCGLQVNIDLGILFGKSPFNKCSEYLNFERSQTLEDSGFSSQEMRDYLNARPWDQSDSLRASEVDLPLIQSRRNDICLRLLELCNQGNRPSSLPLSHLWRIIVQLRDIALRPQGRSLEDRERIRYMAVRSLLKLVNQLRQNTECASFARDIEALLANLALADRCAYDYLTHEIEMNPENAAWKGKISHRCESRDNEIWWNGTLGVMVTGILLFAGVVITNSQEPVMQVLPLVTVYLGVSSFASIIFAGPIAYKLHSLYRKSRDRYYAGSASPQGLRAYLDSEHWREIEAPPVTRIRATPQDAAIRENGGEAVELARREDFADATGNEGREENK